MLSKTHLKLLYLVKQNKLSIEEIASKLKMHEDECWGLIRGDSLSYPPDLVKEFQAELAKVDHEVEARISRKAAFAKEACVNKLKTWAEGKHNYITKTGHRQLIDALNVLKTEVPEVNITSYTWKQGITMEEALDEFKRLTALAKGSVERGRISKALDGGAAKVSRLDGSLDSDTEDTQTVILPAEPKARIFP